MTTEDMIERFIEEGVRAYKRNWEGSTEKSRINMHLPITFCGQEFRYWREIAVYKVGEQIHDFMPSAQVDVYIDGNDSYISVELTDEEQRKLNGKMADFFRKLDESRKGRVFI